MLVHDDGSRWDSGSAELGKPSFQPLESFDPTREAVISIPSANGRFRFVVVAIIHARTAPGIAFSVSALTPVEVFSLHRERAGLGT